MAAAALVACDSSRESNDGGGGAAGVVRDVRLSATDGGEFDPARVDTAFSSGTRGVAARYVYEGARPGKAIQLEWRFQGQPIFDQAENLRDSSGTSTWVLRMGRGSPLPDGAYELEIRYDGSSVRSVPFSVGGSVPNGTETAATAVESGLEAGGADRSPIPPTDQRASDARDSTALPMRPGDEVGERAAGLTYTNEARGLSMAVPSYAWRFDPAPVREPENLVVVGRFAPSGAGLALLRVRSGPATGSLQTWAGGRQREARARDVVKSREREIGGRSFLQVESLEGGAHALTAYTLEGSTGFIFEFKADRRAFAALEDEFQQILGSVRLSAPGTANAR